jgi:pimeloyl-ACP methyl ester carboxylesterase
MGRAGRRGSEGPDKRMKSLDISWANKCQPGGKLLKEAKVPVRCINSAGGYKFFAPTAVETNKKYADFGAVTIDDVGHQPMLEKPDEFNRKLRDVLKEFATKK